MQVKRFSATTSQVFLAIGWIFGLHPHSDPPNNDVDMEAEERMFEKAKMYTDGVNGCFTNKEILSIRLLGIMRGRHYGVPLKIYRRIVALFKDVITKREAITTTFPHQHTAIKHFSQRFCMKGLYPTILTQPSPLNNCFYPAPAHNAQALIESLLYSSLVKDDNNLIFLNPDNPLAAPPSEVPPNIADIDTGNVHRNAPHKKPCTRPNHGVCGIICYTDKLAMDLHGHLSFELVYFPSPIFYQKTQN
jgi:hypothetical protein